MCGSRHSNSMKNFNVTNQTGGICHPHTHDLDHRQNDHNPDSLFCFNCNSILPIHSSKLITNAQNTLKYCRNCGEKLAICPISWKPFRTGDEFAQCEHCFTLFHYHHLIDWLKTNTECPICHQVSKNIVRGTVGVNGILT